MWVVKNNITGQYFAGWMSGMPVTSKKLTEAHRYANWGDAAQICTVLIGNWEPTQIEN